MSDNSIRDILERFGVDDKSDEVIELVGEATNSGVSEKKATPPILVHIIHLNTDMTWSEICKELDLDIQDHLNLRRELVKNDVITSKVKKPSNLVRGKPAELLKEIENSHSYDIFDGSNPYSWVCGAIYIDEWINLRNTDPDMVSDRYHCKVGDIVSKSEKLVNYDEFDRVYGDVTIDGPLSTILSRRRHTIGTLRESLGDTSDEVRKRLGALDRESEYQLKKVDFAGIKFYWAEED